MTILFESVGATGKKCAFAAMISTRLLILFVSIDCSLPPIESGVFAMTKDFMALNQPCDQAAHDVRYELTGKMESRDKRIEELE